MENSHILNLGISLFHRVASYLDLERLMDTNNEWIHPSSSNSGRRHIVHDATSTSGLVTKGVLIALGAAGLETGDLTHFIAAKLNSEHILSCIGHFLPGAWVAAPSAHWINASSASSW
jgi:3-oxoacyl-[acyl-carrier-protein] synthase III